MTKAVAAVKARQQFGTLLNEVDLKGTQVVIERDGKPMAVMISYRQYTAWFKEREQSFERLEAVADAIAEKLGVQEKNQDDLLELIGEAAAFVRQRKQRQ